MNRVWEIVAVLTICLFWVFGVVRAPGAVWAKVVGSVIAAVAILMFPTNRRSPESGE